METLIRGRNLEVTPALEEYVQKKLHKLAFFFDQETTATVTLTVEKNRHTVEVTIPFDGLVARAEERTSDMYASIDRVVDKLEHQLKKNRTRQKSRQRLSAMTVAAEYVEEDVPERVVRTKAFPVKPMDVTEAILQMNLVGHEFFAFRDATSNEVHVLYRRYDGQYGLLVPGE